MKSFIRINEPLTLRKDVLQAAFLAGDVEESQQRLQELSKEKAVLRKQVVENLKHLEKEAQTFYKSFPQRVKKKELQQEEPKKMTHADLYKGPVKKVAGKGKLSQDINELRRRISQL